MGMGNPYGYLPKSDLHQFLREQREELNRAYENLNLLKAEIERQYNVMNLLGTRDPADRKRRQEIYDEIKTLKMDKQSILNTIADHKSTIAEIKRALDSPR